LDLSGGKWQKAGEDCIMRSFITCTLPNVIRVLKLKRMKWAGHVPLMETMRNAYNILVRKAEEKNISGRPRRRCEDSIRMDLTEISWEGVDWIYLA
jgi:hypothetical protein